MDVSGQRFIDQLLEHTSMLRNAGASSVVVNGDGGLGFSN
jgi:hypothetical protein